MISTVLRQGSELAGGRYVLARRLGRGGMATVWLASDERLRRPVAIKLPTDALLADPTFARRFEREAQTAAGLSHPNLVSVYDYGSEGGRPYLVSEYIEGASLEKLRERGEAPPTEIVTRALLAALAHIHAAGIVHRDVKPGNVLVEDPNRILLTDFGIAQSTEETRLTHAGHVIGTFDFIAPEIKRGERATPGSDLYSCGVVLRQQLSDNDPDGLHRLVERLTAEDPLDRPRSAEEALDMLDARDEPATSTMPVAPALVPPSPVAPRPPASVLGDSGPPTDERPLERSERSSGGGPSRLLLGLLAAAAALIVVAVVALGSGDDGGGKRQASADTSTSDQTVTETTTSTATTEAAAPPPEETTDPAAPGDDTAAGIALNDEGYALLQSGDIEGALPTLEQAVAAFPEDSTDINYAYALFNYAQALRLSGDPASAIPLLEKRLAISDYKVDVVEAELATAQAEASGKKVKEPKEKD